MYEIMYFKRDKMKLHTWKKLKHRAKTLIENVTWQIVTKRQGSYFEKKTSRKSSKFVAIRRYMATNKRLLAAKLLCFAVKLLCDSDRKLLLRSLGIA